MSSSKVIIDAAPEFGRRKATDLILKSYEEFLITKQDEDFNLFTQGSHILSELLSNTKQEWREKLEVYIFLFQVVIPPDQLLPIDTSAYHFFAANGLLKEITVCVK